MSPFARAKPKGRNPKSDRPYGNGTISPGFLYINGFDDLVGMHAGKIGSHDHSSSRDNGTRIVSGLTPDRSPSFDCSLHTTMTTRDPGTTLPYLKDST